MSRLNGVRIKSRKLRRAIKLGKPIVIRYTDADGVVTWRRIEPMYAKKTSNGPQVVAYCSLRKAIRSFSLANIG
jgi:predicted DNA-binding transcriptional regulator YafY